MFPQILSLRPPVSLKSNPHGRSAAYYSAEKVLHDQVIFPASKEFPTRGYHFKQAARYAHRFLTKPTAELQQRYINGVRTIWQDGLRRGFHAAYECNGIKSDLSVKDMSVNSRPHLPVEIELVKKALITGLKAEAIYAMPVHPVGSADDAKNGRFEQLIFNVASFAFKQAVDAHETSSPWLAAYWLSFGVPAGHEDETLFDLRDLSAEGISGIVLNNILYANIVADKRRPTNAIFRFAYLGHDFGGTGKSCNRIETVISLHLPNSFKIYPKKPFPIGYRSDIATVLGKRSVLWGFSGQHTLMVSTNAGFMNQFDVSSGSLPATFVGPHLHSSMMRALTAVSGALNFKPEVSLPEMAALMSAYSSAQRNPMAAINQDLQRNFSTTPEGVFALRHERGVVVSSLASQTTTELATSYVETLNMIQREYSSTKPITK